MEHPSSNGNWGVPSIIDKEPAIPVALSPWVASPLSLEALHRWELSAPCVRDLKKVLAGLQETVEPSEFARKRLLLDVQPHEQLCLELCWWELQELSEAV